MALQRIQNVLLEDMQITFRNFAGRKQQYNDAGKRNFALLLDPEQAEAMAADGWNVKFLNAREDEEPQAFIKVNVNFDSERKPKIVMKTSRRMNRLDEDLVSAADIIDIKHVDVVINPYRREPTDKFSAFLKTMFIIVEEDPLDIKYGLYDEDDALELTAHGEDDYVDGEVIDERRAIGGEPPF